MADAIPPPPSGFTVDADPDAASSDHIPAPPAGFKLDNAAADTPKARGAVENPGDIGAGQLFGDMAKGIAGPVAHVAGTLADVFTGTSPGAGSHAERWAAPFAVTDELGQLTPAQQKAHQAVGNAVSSGYDKLAGTGPLAQTVKERVPQAAEAISAVVPVLRAAETAAPMVASIPGKIGSAARSYADRPIVGAPSAEAAVPLASTDQVASGRQSMGAAQVNPSPFQLTGQETGRGSPSFPQVKLAKNSGDVAPEEQSTRAGIVKEVLDDAGEDAGIRTGVLTGNEQTLRSEYQAAKNPNQTPANGLMAAQIGAEQRALPKFAQRRIDATGADPTLANDYQRGETINNAFYGPEDSLKSYLGQQKQKIFQAALDKNGASVIPTDTTDALLSDPQFQAGLKLSGHEGVASGAQDLISLAKKTGFKDPITGEQYAPGSVAAWNAVTKALNKGWTPDNAVTVRAINGAINQDIALSGGGELYQLGNKVHQLEKGLLADSPGINKVFGEVDPNGVQTAKAFETIPRTLNDMPLDQWRHIHDTLDTLSRGQLRGAPEGMDPVPEGLQQAAARAKAEMQGALAREVYSQGAGNAGGWNANAANKALNGRVGQKILDVAPPDEVRKFQTLNAAGQIMPGSHPYEGAGAQTARMGNEPGFVENYAPKAGAALGAQAAGPAGMWVGEKVGSKISGFTKSSREATHAKSVSDTLRNNLNLAQPDTGIARASGGKVDHDALVEKLYQRWKSAKRDTDKSTKGFLGVPDAAIIRALEVAQEHI